MPLQYLQDKVHALWCDILGFLGSTQRDMPISCSTYALFLRLSEQPETCLSSVPLTGCCFCVLCPPNSQSQPPEFVLIMNSALILSPRWIYFGCSPHPSEAILGFLCPSLFYVHICVCVGVCVYFLTAGWAVFNVFITHSNVLFLKRITLQPCIVSGIKYVINK